MIELGKKMSKKTQGHYAKKRFGQNFLQDQAVIDQIVYAIHPQENDNIIEIGPGLGAMTKPILTAIKQMTVIELDRDVIPKLQKNCANLGELNIVEADVLTVDFSALSLKRAGLEARPYRIIGNLPYNISTPLLFYLMQYRDQIKDMHFMLQKEVVDRMAAEPNTKTYGRLSVMMQFFCEVEPLFIVPPEAFLPAPKVDSMIVRLKPRQNLNVSDEFIQKLSEVVQKAFSQRRKTIWNNLKGFIDAETIIAVGEKNRAENLSVDSYVQITEKQFKYWTVIFLDSFIVLALWLKARDLLCNKSVKVCAIAKLTINISSPAILCAKRS